MKLSSIFNQLKISFNYFGFTIVWFCCAFSAKNENFLLAIIPTTIYIIIHLQIVSKKKVVELKLISLSLFLGIIVDSLLSWLGIVKYAGSWENFPNLSPIWILCMWIGFASQIFHSLKFLRGRFLLIGFYGILAPLAYIGGEKIQAVQVSAGMANMVIISALWVISLVILFKFAECLNKR